MSLNRTEVEATMDATNISALPVFLGALDRLVDPAATAAATVRPVRELLASALIDPVFRFDCIEGIVAALDPAGAVGWRYPKIHRNVAQNYSVCVFSWPAGLANTPHRHDTWTVTGVLHGTLRFNTFRIGSAETPLLPDKRIEAVLGDVGYICTPCIHNVENPGTTAALSIHVFNHLPAGQQGSELVEYAMAGTVAQPGGADRIALDAAMREPVLAACAVAIGALPHPGSLKLLERILDLAVGRAALAAIKSMAEFNPAYAARRAQAVAERIGGRYAEHLHKIGAVIP